MNAIQKLEKAVMHGETFDDLATKIHDRFEAGAAEMQAIYADVDNFVSSTLDRARTAAASFKDGFTKVQSKVEGTASDLDADTKKPEPDAPAPTEAVVTTPTPTTTIAVVPAAADPTPVLTSVGPVTVDPGTTVHTDADTGVTTIVPHDGTEATATDVSGATVTAPAAAVAEAVAASADAGVTLPVAA